MHHMLEVGVDQSQILKAFGHESLNTMEIYTCQAQDNPNMLTSRLPGVREANLTDTNKFRFRSPIDHMEIRI